MALPNITLKHLEHRGGKHIALFFDYDIKLIDHTRKLKGAKWSATNKCWYVNDRTGIMDRLQEHLTGKATLENKTSYPFGQEGIKAQPTVYPSGGRDQAVQKIP